MASSSDSNIARILSSLRHQLMESCCGESDESECNHITPLMNIFINASLGISICPRNKSSISQTSSPSSLPNHRLWSHDSPFNDLSQICYLPSSCEPEECGRDGHEHGHEHENMECLESIDIVNSNGNKATSGQSLVKIHYGEFCKFVLEFLASNYESSLGVDSHWHDSSPIIAKLVRLCHDNHKNRQILYENQVSSTILTNFKNILILNDIKYRPFQTVLMELFVEISLYKISASEMKLLLNLLKEQEAPVSLYLKNLHQLFDSQRKTPYSPLHCIEFPSEPLMFSELNQAHVESWIGQIRSELISEDTRSSWEVSALAISLLKNSNPLIMTNKMFSLAFWACLDKIKRRISDRIRNSSMNSPQHVTTSNKIQDNNYYEMIHMFSIAFDVNTLEVWYDFVSNHFIIKLCTLIDGKSNSLCEQVLDCDKFMFENDWNFLCFNFKEIKSKKSLSINIFLFINGVSISNTCIPINDHNILPKNPHSTAILVGTTQCPSQEFHWKLGNLMLFRRLLSNEAMFYLYCLGSDYSDFSFCQVNNNSDSNIKVRIPASINRTFIIETLPSFLQLLDDNLYRTIQEGILILYSPKSENHYLMYQSSKPSVMPITLSLPSLNAKSLSASTSNPLSLGTSHYHVKQGHVIKFATLYNHNNPGIESLIVDVGGIGSFIFLFAFIVENFDDSEMQTQSLDILHKACYSHDQHMDIFLNEYDGLSLISYVLEKSKFNSSVTTQMMHIFMKFVLIQKDAHQLVISAESIASFASSWKVWFRSKETESLFFETLFALANDSNPYANINLIQMRRGSVLDILLRMIQEMCIESEHLNRNLAVNSCIKLISTFEQLIGTTEPDLSLFSKVYNCTLLLHKPEFAYIYHSRNSFYFNLSCIWNFDLERQVSEQLNDDEWDIISENDPPNDSSSSLSNENIDYIIAGLLSLMENVILIADQSIIDQIIGQIINLQYLVVLANNQSFTVRESALSTLITCFKKCKDSESYKNFLKIKGFQLMANQLHNFSASTKLIEMCFGSILNHKDIREFCLEETLALPNKCDFNQTQLKSFVLLFSLLPKCTSKPSLCHVALQWLNKIIEVNEGQTFLKSLYDNGILECLAKIVIVNDHDHCVEGYEIDIINHDISNLLSSLARRFFTYSGNGFYQMFCNILIMNSILEKKVRSKKKIFRACQLAVFDAVFEEMQKLSFEVNKEERNSLKNTLGSNNSQSFLNLFVSPDVTYETDRGTFAQDNASFKTESSFQSVAQSSSNQNSIEFTLESSSSNTKLLSPKEIVTRYNDVLLKTTDFILCKDSGLQPTNEEKYFARTILHFLSQDYKLIEQNRRKKKPRWVLILWKCRDTLRAQFCRLILYLLSPLQTIDERQYIAELILTSFDFLPSFLSSNINFKCYFIAFIHDLVECSEKDQAEKLSDLPYFLLVRNKSGAEAETFKEDIGYWFNSHTKIKSVYESTLSSAEKAVFDRFKTTCETISENAMSITRSIVETQYRERKEYINQLKQQRTNNFELKEIWKSIVRQFTHEKAIWYFEDAFPKMWELDPTDGPDRIRRKLKRCHSNINKKFFMDKDSNVNTRSLLSFLFEEDSRDSSALIDRLHANELITYTCPCTIITPDEEYPGEILVNNKCIHFVGEEMKSNKADMADVFTEMWPFEDIQEIQKRRWQLQNNAIEIFLSNGLTYMIAFQSSAHREEFQKNLFSHPLPNLSENKDLITLMQMWRCRKITNFSYLMQLNKFSGRTFNDLMQYPVFPFIISYYEKGILNLRESESFRNLSRPMAVQYKHREKYYIDQFNYIKNEYERSKKTQEYMIAATTAPYHFGSHYSNSGTVLHFLVRLPPFTQMFLNYQDNSFDIPDRTFHSIATSYRLSTLESTTDFKELIPEFFYFPEFLLNNSGFDFGVRQNGQRVDHVILPEWCRGNARLFVLINRQALESNHVTLHLNNWIDLVFGNKQTGKAAVDAINVFHPATYFGTDISKEEDPLRRTALQTMIKTFGQMPVQLFNAPHPAISSDSQLSKESGEFKSVMSEVEGLKWGHYVGSPCLSDPIVVWKKHCITDLSTFVQISTNDMIGLPANSCLLMTYNRQKAGLNASYITSSAIINWANPDGIVRVQMDSASIPFLSANTFLDEISFCASIPNYDVLMVGYASGLISVYVIDQQMKLNRKIKIKKKSGVRLIGHESRVNKIAICKTFMSALSGDANGVCILWDLNRLCYTRTIVKHDEAIELLCMSETLGDIVSVSHCSQVSGSTLMCHTINGEIVGQVVTQHRITAICYSSAPEGISVNVIAIGFTDGTIQLRSSWDLTLVREIKDERFEKPIKCISYSSDNQSLYVAYVGGTVFVWETKHHKESDRQPKLKLLNVI